MHVFDEETIIGKDLTSQGREERLDLAKRLPAASIRDIDDIEEVETRTELRITANSAIFPFEVLDISNNCPFVFNGSRIRMYDGMIDRFAATENILEDVGTPDEDGFVMLIRVDPVTLSNTPIKMGVDVVSASVSDIVVSENFTQVKVKFSVSAGKEVIDDLKDRISNTFIETFPSENTVNMEEVGRSGIQFYALESSTPINTAIFNYLVMNDPVMSLLYAVTGYKNLKQKLRLVRRNSRNDFVELTQLRNQTIGIKFAVKSGSSSQTVLKKIIASIEYYNTRQESVRLFYDRFSVGGRKLLSGFDLEPIAEDEARKQRVPFTGNTEIFRNEQVLRTKLDCAVAMQANPGISYETLKMLSSTVDLDPRRWCDAASAGNKIDIYLFNTNGIVIPRSRLGLYKRRNTPPNAKAIFIFVKKNGCMLLVKKEEGAVLKLHKKIDQLNEKYTSNQLDFKLACVPPAIKSILGDEFLICPVSRGDKSSGFLKCIEAATTTENYNFTSIFSANSRDAKRAKKMLDTLSLFYAGGGVVEMSITPPDARDQYIDEHGKNCGVNMAPNRVSAPIPATLVRSSIRKSIVDAFSYAKRENNMLMQICLFAFSNYLNNENDAKILQGTSLQDKLDAHELLEKRVHEFVKERLIEYRAEKFEFYPVLKKNDKEKIGVPNTDAMTFFLLQSIKSPNMIVGYRNRIMLEDYFARGAFRQSDTLNIPVSVFSKWRRSRQM